MSTVPQSLRSSMLQHVGQLDDGCFAQQPGLLRAEREFVVPWNGLSSQQLKL